MNKEIEISFYNVSKHTYTLRDTNKKETYYTTTGWYKDKNTNIKQCYGYGPSPLLALSQCMKKFKETIN